MPPVRTLLVATSLVLIACSSSPTIAGSLTVIGDVDKTATTCAAGGGYDDMHDGAEVVVKDGAGAVIGTGRLAFNADADKRANVCVWDFSAPSKTSDFYQISIGHRSPVTYSAAELEAAGWFIGLSLGQ